MVIESEKVELTLAEAEIFRIDPNALYIIAYDLNVISHKQMRELGQYLMASGRISYAPALLAYDSQLTENPLKIYEVKHADSK